MMIPPPRTPNAPRAIGAQAQPQSKQAANTLQGTFGTIAKDTCKVINAPPQAKVSSPPAPASQHPTDTEPAYSTRRNGQQAGDFSRSPRTPMQAIRAFCLECVCGQRQEVELCPASNCPLFGYRFGVRPTTAQAAGKVVSQ